MLKKSACIWGLDWHKIEGLDVDKTYTTLRETEIKQEGQRIF